MPDNKHRPEADFGNFFQKPGSSPAQKQSQVYETQSKINKQTKILLIIFGVLAVIFVVYAYNAFGKKNTLPIPAGYHYVTFPDEPPRLVPNTK